MPQSANRRTFLKGTSILGLGLLSGEVDATTVAEQADDPCRELGPLAAQARIDRFVDLRIQAAENYKQVPIPDQTCNGDEDKYAKDGYYASHTKALVQINEYGEVDPTSYKSLLDALKGGDPALFDKITLGCPQAFRAQFAEARSRKVTPENYLVSTTNPQIRLTDPQAGLAFSLEGIDPHLLAIPPAFTFNSADEIGEMAECYWMALARDVPFAYYDTDPTTYAAAADLSQYSKFHGPKPGGAVTTSSLFRGFTVGDLRGPYVSQFLLRDIPYGSQRTSGRIHFGVPETDYLVDPQDWLMAQKGCAPKTTAGPMEPRYIYRGRDLAQYVHIDELFQAYFNACLLLISPLAMGGFGAHIDPGNPYALNKTQIGFGTLGEPNFKTLTASVATYALQTVWFQKWFVHRRLRPEVFGGRVHFHLKSNGKRKYDFDLAELDKLQAVVLPKVYNRSKGVSYLLPMAFPEGCPMHPAYGAGHATVAGACVTVLKAIFKEDDVLTDLEVQPLGPSPYGDTPRPYNGPDRDLLTVGGELNKLAANIALARNFAGVHWRSDYTESLKLGEKVGLYFLQDRIRMYNERVTFNVTRFDGSQVTVTKDKFQTF